MRLPRTPRLRLEPLEPRDCPAFNIYFTGAALNVVGRPVFNSPAPGDGVFFEMQPGGNLRVRETAGVSTVNYGTYRVVGDLNVTLQNYNTSFNVALNGLRLPGNVTFNLGVGDTSTLSVNPISIYGGTVGGNVTVRGGSGLEVINLGRTGAPADAVTVQGDVIVNASAATNPNDFAGVGDLVNVNVGSRLLRNLLTTQVDSINVGEFGGPATVNGMVTLNVRGSGNTGELSVFGRVGGQVAFVGSDAPDPFGIGDSVEVEPGAEVVGPLTAAFGAGQSEMFVFPGGQLDSNLTVAAGNDPDTVVILGTVLGSVNLTLFGGDNTVAFTGSVLGDFNVNAGNGNNDLSVFAGTVNGNLTITLGNGDNVFVFNGALGGPRLTFTSGSGDDSVEINGVNAFALYASLGAGADTVTITDDNGVGQARIDFGLDFDADVWNPPAQINFPLVLLNYP